MISNREALVKKNAPRSERHSPEYQATLRYADWLSKEGKTWTSPDFYNFVLYLIERNVDREQIEFHLETIRECYANVARDKTELIKGIAASESDDESQWKERISEIKSAMKQVATGEYEPINLDEIYQAIASVNEKYEEHTRLKKSEQEKKHEPRTAVPVNATPDTDSIGDDNSADIVVFHSEQETEISQVKAEIEKSEKNDE